MRASAILELSNGKSMQGSLIGASCETSGELVFTTAMVGYSEALTDPSYYGQILVFSYPLIGNYGIPALKKKGFDLRSKAWESDAVHAKGVVISSYSPETFHWTSGLDLDSWLSEQNKVGICDIDTRELVRQIREEPQLFARIRKLQPLKTKKPQALSLKNYDFFDPNKKEIVPFVSSKKRQVFGSAKLRIAVLDCGVKWNILRQIIKEDCSVELLPYDTDLSTVDCDGFLLSNGPGNPNYCSKIVSQVKKLLKQDRPILGICLGHQILSLAASAKIKKMNYGHRSHNQPVRIPGDKKSYITCQNHSYEVLRDSLNGDFEVWFENINDQSVEGIRSKTKPFSSVQFHPEASGGPRDTAWILKDFVSEVRAYAR